MADEKNQKINNSVVKVGCKMPNGIILRLDNMVETQEPMFGGGFRNVKTAQQVASVQLFGTAVPFGAERPCLIVGGYAITNNVSGEFMEKWLEQHKDSDLVRNKIIIVHDRDTDGLARENKSVRSNLEPLDPNSKKGKDYVDPRMPKQIKPGTEPVKED